MQIYPSVWETKLLHHKKLQEISDARFPQDVKLRLERKHIWQDILLKMLSLNFHEKGNSCTFGLHL